jgi:putative ABC transport system ATP-binding protein
MSVDSITAEGLSLEGAGTLVVQDLDLHVRSGEMLGIGGPSGSGKTTLLYAIGGLLPAARGQLLVDGRPLVLWKEASVGLIFQNLCLVPFLTAQETVALPLQAKGVARAEVADRSTAALSALGLADHAAQLVGDLSGGQRQRVAVARALACGPDVILADEPTSALDEHWRDVVLDLLTTESKRGRVIIVASSDTEVIAVCDEVISLAPAG